MKKKWLGTIGFTPVLAKIGLRSCNNGNASPGEFPTELLLNLNNQQEKE
jgi:hypothetical protein